MNDYYGMRRKRNIKLLADHERPNEFIHTSPAWDGAEGLEDPIKETEEGYEKEEENEESLTALSIDGIPFVTKQKLN